MLHTFTIACEVKHDGENSDLYLRGLPTSDAKNVYYLMHFFDRFIL